MLIKPKIWEPLIEAAKKRLQHNVLAIALANKLARIARSGLARGRNFEVRKIDETAQTACSSIAKRSERSADLSDRP